MIKTICKLFWALVAGLWTILRADLYDCGDTVVKGKYEGETAE